MTPVVDAAPKSPGKENITANQNAYIFLEKVYGMRRARMQDAPIDLAKQIFKMLTSCNIAVSADMYQLLVDIAIQGESLEMATEMSILMEKHTGRSLPPELQNKMIDLHITSGLNYSQTTKSGCTDALKAEMIAQLTSHKWFGTSSAGRQQTHQIFACAQNRLRCLTMTGEASPTFVTCDLTWGGPDGKSLCWGCKFNDLNFTSTCADIKEGTLKWDAPGGCSWEWFAWQTQTSTMLILCAQH